MNTKDMGKIIRRRLRQDKDCVVAITGEEGEGKSVLGIQLSKVIDSRFTMERNILFSPNKDKVLKKIIGLPRYSVVDVDEAIKVLYKLRWGHKISIFINMVYALCRKENKASLLLMPRFKDFNEYFRNHRIKIWIHVIERGMAVVFAKDWSPFSDDVWRMDENEKLIKKFSRRKRLFGTDTETKIRILERSSNFLDVLVWDDLDPNEKTVYEKLRDASKYDDLWDSGERESERVRQTKDENLKLVLFVKDNFKLTDKEIGDVIGVSPDAIKQRRLRSEKSRNKGTE